MVFLQGFRTLIRWVDGEVDMIVLCRPGMGKTAFVLTMCENVAVDENIPCTVLVECHSAACGDLPLKQKSVRINSKRYS